MGTVGGTASITNTAGVTQTVGAYSVTLAPAAGTSGTGTMDDRDRDFSFSPTLTYAELYDDFVFNSAIGGGLRLTVGGGELVSNTEYLVSIYVYDHGSAGTRTANYVDQNNSDAFVLTTSFAGGSVPATDDANKYTGKAVTDANGVLSLRGFTTSASAAVFISGFEINPVPEPATAVSLIGLAGLFMFRRRSR
jgi:hypothetical protein